MSSLWARRTTATITQPGITALERHFENLKVLAFVLARSSDRTRGAGVKRATRLPPSDVGEGCIGIMSTYLRDMVDLPGVQRGIRDRVRAIRLPLHEGETGSPRPTPPARRSPPNSDATPALESLQDASAKG